MRDSTATAPVFSEDPKGRQLLTLPTGELIPIPIVSKVYYVVYAGLGRPEKDNELEPLSAVDQVLSKTVAGV